MHLCCLASCILQQQAAAGCAAMASPPQATAWNALNPEAPSYFPNYHLVNLTHQLPIFIGNHPNQQYLPSASFINHSVTQVNPYLYYSSNYFPSNPVHVISSKHAQLAASPLIVCDQRNHCRSTVAHLVGHTGPFLPNEVVVSPSPEAGGDTDMESSSFICKGIIEPMLEPVPVLATGRRSDFGCQNSASYLRKDGTGNPVKEDDYGCCRTQHAKKKERKSNERNGSESCRRKVRSGERSSAQGHFPVLPVRPNGDNTTVMIRNIPNRYTREMLMQFLDNHCMMENEKAVLQESGSTKEAIVSSFDFLYLPMDFEKGANKGYAFVNFTDARAVWKFHLAAHNQAWGHFHSHKIREIACAKLQGKEQLVRHFHDTRFECGSEKYLPVCFSPPRDGSRGVVCQKLIGNYVHKKCINVGDHGIN